MTKSDLRRQCLARLKALSKDERARHSISLAKALTRDSAVAVARTIAVFDPLPSEPDITPFIAETRRIRPEVRFCYPRCHGDALQFFEVISDDQLAPVEGRHFREPLPASCPPINPAKFDLILVPGLAFAADGSARLGRGGGYYDRLLADPALRAASIGICFASQLHNDIPVEPHDAPVHRIITESSTPSLT